MNQRTGYIGESIGVHIEVLQREHALKSLNRRGRMD